MNKRGDRLPLGISLKTERAKRRLANAGILRAHQLRPRHWRLLRAFANQEPEPFTAGDATDAQRPARLQLNIDQVPAHVLREL